MQGINFQVKLELGLQIQFFQFLCETLLYYLLTSSLWIERIYRNILSSYEIKWIVSYCEPILYDKKTICSFTVADMEFFMLFDVVILVYQFQPEEDRITLQVPDGLEIRFYRWCYFLYFFCLFLFKFWRISCDRLDFEWMIVEVGIRVVVCVLVQILTQGPFFGFLFEASLFVLQIKIHLILRKSLKLEIQHRQIEVQRIQEKLQL